MCSNKTYFFFDCLPSYDSGYLEVGNGHSIYFEQYGNPEGIPIIFLHGGPGAGFSNSHKSFFDPKIFRVVFFGPLPRPMSPWRRPRRIVCEQDKLRPRMSSIFVIYHSQRLRSARLARGPTYAM